MRKMKLPVICFSAALPVAMIASLPALAQDTGYSSDTSSDSNQAGISSQNQDTGVDNQVAIESHEQQPGIAADTSMSQNQPGIASDMTGTSTAVEAPPAPNIFQNEKVAVQPQGGVINFRDASNAISNRATYGMGLDWNLTKLFSEATDMGKGGNFYIGPQTGFFFSHIGAVGGNFFGSNGSGNVSNGANAGDPGANMFFVPTDLKAGYGFSNFRLSAHGGANLIYRSNASSLVVGSNPNTGSGGSLAYLPNAGLDLEWSPSNSVAVLIRPDWTFGGSNRMFGGTIGVSLPIT